MYTNVKINETEYPVSFGMNALAKFTRNAGLSLKELGNLQEMLDLQNTLLLVFCGLHDGHRKAKKMGDVSGVFSLEVEDIGDMLDEDQTALERILNVFTEAMPTAGNGQAQTAKAKRKKLVSTN